MKAVFLGGGSLRLLPILRGIFAKPEILADGEIVLVDRDLKAAEAVGSMMLACPEYAEVGCRISWTDDLDASLPGTDVFYLTMAVGSAAVKKRSQVASIGKGFIYSDQLSIGGSFHALNAGTTILHFARKLEKYAPDAIMQIFVNPVAIYSGVVNNYTKIRALGICGGYTNHRWDLTRILGKNEYCDDYRVKVAGINHLSLILEGTVNGRDLYEVLGEHITDDWKQPEYDTELMEYHVSFALERLVWMYRKFGKVIFSTEGDGMTHFFYEDYFLRAKDHYLEKLKCGDFLKGGQVTREEMYRKFYDYMASEKDDAFWNGVGSEDPLLARNTTDIANDLFRALAGQGDVEIVASFPNHDTVKGFDDIDSLEFNLKVGERSIKPVYNGLDMPKFFHSVIAPIVDHQTMVAKAIAEQDPKVFAEALFCYPIKQNTRDSKQLFLEMLEIHKDEIPPVFQKAGDYIV